MQPKRDNRHILCRGEKDEKQIKESMNNYKSEYGIIISNKTQQIEKEDDVIFIPPRTFALHKF